VKIDKSYEKIYVLNINKMKEENDFNFCLGGKCFFLFRYGHNDSQ